MVRAEIDKRVLEVAEYIADRSETVRAAAEHFGCSKSTVHKYMTERLEHIDRHLYQEVRLILEQNKAERHIRGGLATRKKYRGA